MRFHGVVTLLRSRFVYYPAIASGLLLGSQVSEWVYWEQQLQAKSIAGMELEQERMTQTTEELMNSMLYKEAVVQDLVLNRITFSTAVDEFDKIDRRSPERFEKLKCMYPDKSLNEIVAHQVLCYLRTNLLATKDSSKRNLFKQFEVRYESYLQNHH
jgi:hypothetical protein